MSNSSVSSNRFGGSSISSGSSGPHPHPLLGPLVLVVAPHPLIATVVSLRPVREAICFRRKPIIATVTKSKPTQRCSHSNNAKNGSTPSAYSWGAPSEWRNFQSPQIQCWGVKQTTAPWKNSSPAPSPILVKTTPTSARAGELV
ncbi:hypothetical protein GBAR_LOCUS8388 [Geodia barretti]|uniref:Uncharacterized protein n=1 Tax=Geodia barretti TaxID=519541 RepID=A0AA35RLC0_GEOBA|nr:hypothetical protein GBAR_LOCUS8388 [Geodia barretti]